MPFRPSPVLCIYMYLYIHICSWRVGRSQARARSPSLSPSLSLSLSPSLPSSLCLSCLSVCLSVCLSLSFSVCLSVCLSITEERGGEAEEESKAVVKPELLKVKCVVKHELLGGREPLRTRAREAAQEQGREETEKRQRRVSKRTRAARASSLSSPQEALSLSLLKSLSSELRASPLL